ncbi:hypothetical protein IY804_04020, partial [Campylobacter volucris]|uniref:hypothetical protein n=1 Tax=Campylobacter volucris TaxID=1031542 RepID=UPI00189D4708
GGNINIGNNNNSNIGGNINAGNNNNNNGNISTGGNVNVSVDSSYSLNSSSGNEQKVESEETTSEVKEKSLKSGVKICVVNDDYKTMNPCVASSI